MTEITDLAASELSSAIRQHELSCVEVMQAYLERIAHLNPVYNALVSLRDPDACLSDAKTADDELAAGNYRGWMHGMPHAVKDLSDVAGLPTSMGSPLFAGTVAEADSPFVERVRSAGAIFVGKTNTPEWGLGSQTYNAVFGATVNAYDPSLAAGGSSGGAAVALATRMLPVADGSDMMGSLRNPAGFNNVVGLRPTTGLVPPRPARDKSILQLGTDGPMGREVADTARLFETLTGIQFDDFAAADLRACKLGWLGDYRGYLPFEEGVVDLCSSRLQGLVGAGCSVEDCVPDFDMARLWQCWLTLRQRTFFEDRDIYADPDRRSLMKPEWQWEVQQGLAIDERQLADAHQSVLDWKAALNKLFEQYNLLVLPTAQVFPFSIELQWPKSIDGRDMDTYHRWMEVTIGATLAGLPAVALPAGFDIEGRAMGLQFIGPAGQDRKVLEFALAYEAATGLLPANPPLRSS